MTIDLKGVTTADEFFAKLEVNLDDIPPVDVEGICKKLGITIEVADMSDYEKEYGSAISGALVSMPEFTTIMEHSRRTCARRSS